MKSIIISNLSLLIKPISLLIISIASHIVLRTYYNISVLKNVWNFSKFKKGLYKLLSLSVGLFLISIVIILLPDVLESCNIVLNKDILDYYNISTIVLIILKPTIIYTKHNLEDIDKIINSIIEKDKVGDKKK